MKILYLRIIYTKFYNISSRAIYSVLFVNDIIYFLEMNNVILAVTIFLTTYHHRDEIYIFFFSIRFKNIFEFVVN